MSAFISEVGSFHEPVVPGRILQREVPLLRVALTHVALLAGYSPSEVGQQARTRTSGLNQALRIRITDRVIRSQPVVERGDHSGLLAEARRRGFEESSLGHPKDSIAAPGDEFTSDLVGVSKTRREMI